LRLPGRRNGDSLEDQTQRERHFEQRHGDPDDVGHRVVDESRELHGKQHHEQDRGEHTQPGQRDRDASGTQKEVGEERAAQGEAGGADGEAQAALFQHQGAERARDRRVGGASVAGRRRDRQQPM